MTVPPDDQRNLTRRNFLALTGGLAAAAGLGAAAPHATTPPSLAATCPSGPDPTAASPALAAPEPFWGKHQGGIITAPAQKHSYFAAFDLSADNRDDVVALLRTWTAAAAAMSAGQPARPLGQNPDAPGADSAEALELPPARLTITFGFGPGLFIKDGHDRFGLAARRPPALVELPRFNGDQLVPAQTGGDISIQACADDPQVAFHAVRQLARLAYGAAQLRWAQSGFLPDSDPRKPAQTPRNLMGFKDGTSNPSVTDPAAMDQYVWIGTEGPAWMRGGSYLVVRRIRMALEHWDRTNLGFQEQTFGRHKYSGAPLGATHEFDPVDLDANDKDGNPVIPDTSHVRLAMAASNDGAKILRRPYSYNDGLNFTTERWPPWRQGMEYDAGLLFLCYQRDPRTGFIKIFENMAKLDMLNQFVTHVGGGIFACTGGVTDGGYIGQRLFEP